ncbi:MAG: FG-GAP-like repeat-containing protein [Gemmataceae bacterium]|nr:FG-GAP-like repeat-containing protein [Gemmataceae bacterium]
MPRHIARLTGLRHWLLEDRLAPATQLLPDLGVASSYLSGWYINSLPTGRQELRFATAIVNTGAGAFELNGTPTYVTNPDGSQAQLVNQRIYLDNGTSILRPAGSFSFDEDCGDMHFDDMAFAELLLRPGGTGVGGVVTMGEKDGFCLVDGIHTDPALPGSPAARAYKTCGAQVQGISVGWTDVYSSVLDGQSIDITGVPNGDYWLQVTVDPLNHVLESNETNNVTRIPITISSQPTYGFRVLAASPVAVIDGPVSAATLTFNQAVDIASFSPTDFVLHAPGGNVPVSSVSLIDSTNIRVAFPTQSTVGTHTLTLLSSVNTATGSALDQNNNGTGGETADSFSFVFTIPAPKILSSSPAAGVAGPVNRARVSFNKPITSSTFTTADIVSFTGPGGANLAGTITGVVPASTSGTSAIFDVTFTAVAAPGMYRIVIGPNIADPLGHPLDQNLDGTSNSGDNYTASFAISAPGTVGPDAFGYTAAGVTVPTGSIVGRPGTFPIFTNTDDQASQINFGANSFNFYGTSYGGNGKVWVSTNGLMTFGLNAGNYAFVNDDLSTATVPTLAVLWDDWNVGTGSPQVLGLFEDLTGDSVPDRLIVEWNQVKHNAPGATDTGVTFQAILELNTGTRPGTIICSYLDILADNPSYDNGASATVGIVRPAEGASPLLLGFNTSAQPLVQSGKAVSFSVPRVQSVTRSDPSPNATGTGRFQVTFSEGVTGLDASDFTLTGTGTIAGLWIDAVTPTADPRVWDVRFQWFRGAGTVSLTVLDDDSITSLYGAPLAGLGVGGGQFAATPTYSVTEPSQQRLVVGADAGGGPHVRVIRARDQQEVLSFFAFDASFRGGVRVAQGDINGDDVPDIVLGAGPGGGPHVRVFDGRDLRVLMDFYAYGASFRGGVWIAAGDVNNDGKDDVITGADAGGGPHVRVFSGANGSELLGFFAFDPGFVGGVRVAAGDVNGDGKADIVTGAGPGGGPHVRAFSGAGAAPLASFFPYDATFRGGVFVAAGDYDGDGKADIVTGAGAGGGPHVKVTNASGTTLLSLFAPLGGSTTAGVRVGAADLTGDGRADLIMAGGPGATPNIFLRSATGSPTFTPIAAYDPTFLGGIYVGG